MTTTDEASARADASEASEPSIGERLSAARARLGVDIRRAERDTKIRARHLDALERDDPGDLPGPVYRSGFLRTYAAYLELDPDEVVERWRRELGRPRRREGISRPGPLAAPARQLTFS